MVADRKPTRAQLRKKYGVPEPNPKAKYDWDELFKLIPGYDCYAQAGDLVDCHFDAKAAAHVCNFFERFLKHPVGTTEVPAGSPFILQPWQQAVTGCLFGWKHTVKGRVVRRFSKVFVYLGKKNGKSTWAAGIIIYMLTQEKEAMQQLFGVAASKDQVGNMFDPMVEMIRLEPALAKLLTPYGHKGGGQSKAIVYQDATHNHRFVALAADASRADGKPAQGGFIDELHRHEKPELSQVIEENTSARAEPVVFVTSTADSDRESVCNDTRKYAIEVRDNGGDRSKPGYAPHFLPVIYETTSKQDWTAEATWEQANPNLGVTKTYEYMRKKVQEAKDSPRLQTEFFRLHLNQIVSSVSAWLPVGAWDECCDTTITEADLQGRQCWGGLDLASTTDMTALVLLFPLDDGRLFLLPRFWVPESLIQPRSHRNWGLYAEWAKTGHLITTSGNVTDYEHVETDIVELAERFHVCELTVDRSFVGASTQQALQKEGINITTFNQGPIAFTMPTKRFEANVLSQKVVHDGQPVFAWQLKHVKVDSTKYGNVRPVKPDADSKIDGVIAAVMAGGVYELAEPVAEPAMELIF